MSTNGAPPNDTGEGAESGSLTMSTNGAPPNGTGEGAESGSLTMSTNGAPPNDTGEAAGSLSTTNPEEVPKRNNEFYLRINPLGGTWIHAQARLRVALLGPQEEEPEGESEEESEQEEEPQNKSPEDKEKGEEDEFSPEGRPILNMEEVLRSAQLVQDVINNSHHRDAHTVLSTDKPIKNLPTKKGKDWATVGHHDPNATPRQLFRSAYTSTLRSLHPGQKTANPTTKESTVSHSAHTRETKRRLTATVYRTFTTWYTTTSCIFQGIPPMIP